MPVPVDPKMAALAVKTIKFLAVDAIERAESGHPGMPMGAADAAFVLWSQYLRYDPSAPDWPDRDRFVLSAGHGSMLLYALLHLSGYDLPLSELQAFRQWESKTPGHPEFGHTVGVETTTGPLGQGVANGVGMALSAKMAAARFNGMADFKPVTHRVFILAGDGDLMEGVSGEASSLAGHLGLGNLILLYDDNEISIEGPTALTFSEDTGRRYESYGWHVQSVDGHDHEALARALDEAVADADRPSLIRCRTHIANGSPGVQDSAKAHGAPLGEAETRATKRNLDWPLEPRFHIPGEIKAFFRGRAEEGAAMRTAWEQRFDAWRRDDEQRDRLWRAVWERKVPDDLTAELMREAPAEAGATRAHSGAILQKAAALLPGLVGGSADLAPSNKTLVAGSPSIAAEKFEGGNIHFGVREHAMGAIVNGMLYHGAFRPYCGTFLVFSDYMRPALRIAAMSGLPAIYVFTHDSIFVGEDGPTHQPVEHASSLRLIPNLHVFRPADGLETALSWGMALERRGGPTALLLSRQKLPPVDRQAEDALGDLRRGAYLVAGGEGADAVVAASGSELHLAIAAREALAAEGLKINVVSVPCLELFREQDSAYREKLFPEGAAVATIEAGVTAPWREIVGRKGLAIGIDRFGSSAPADILAERHGMTAAGVTARLRAWLRQNRA
jgi:transketolase